MANSPDDTRHAEEEFQKVIAEIGGKERIYLVSNAFRPEQEGEAGLLQEFVRSIFPAEEDAGANLANNSSSNGPQPSASPKQPPGAGDHVSENCVCHVGTVGNDKALNAESEVAVVSTRPMDLALRAKSLGEDNKVQTTTATSINLCSQKRTIDCPIIVFLFRQEFLKGGSLASNELCVKEILKDVRARTERAGAPPALMGLIRAAAEGVETADCVGLLERLIRSVFRKHSPDAIWVGTFIPKTESKILAFKTNACKVFYSRQITDDTKDRGNTLCWPFQCFSWALRGSQTNSPSTNRRRGDTGTIEEGIPLRSDSLSPGPVDCGAADGMIFLKKIQPDLNVEAINKPSGEQTFPVIENLTFEYLFHGGYRPLRNN